MSIVNKGGTIMDMPNNTIDPNILQLSVICIYPLVNTFLQYATCFIVAAN